MRTPHMRTPHISHHEGRWRATSDSWWFMTAKAIGYLILWSTITVAAIAGIAASSVVIGELTGVFDLHNLLRLLGYHP